MSLAQIYGFCLAKQRERDDDILLEQSCTKGEIGR